MRNSIRCLWLSLMGVASTVLHAEPIAADHIKVELISDVTELVPGKTAWLGIALQHDPGWHTYWVNPGDSGLPTKLAWILPAGFAAGDIAWPAPRRFKIGDLYNFGYDDSAVLPVPIKVPADAPAGNTVALSVVAKWLVCHEECIPGTANLKIDLPVAKAGEPIDPDPRGPKISVFTVAHGKMVEARSKIPEVGSPTARSAFRGDRIEVTLGGANLPRPTLLDAFPVQAKVVANAPPKAEMRGRDLVLTFAKSDYFTSMPDQFDLVLVDGSDAPAHLIHAPFARTDPSSATSR